MWQRDWPAVHTALNNEWSDDVINIMHALKGIIKFIILLFEYIIKVSNKNL